MNVVVLDDLNARVGDEPVSGIIGKYDVPGGAERVDTKLEVCTERELVVANTWFKRKIYRSLRAST